MLWLQFTCAVYHRLRMIKLCKVCRAPGNWCFFLTLVPKCSVLSWAVVVWYHSKFPKPPQIISTVTVAVMLFMASSNENISTLLALCVGNPAVTGGVPSQRQWRGDFAVVLIFMARDLLLWNYASIEAKKSTIRWLKLPISRRRDFVNLCDIDIVHTRLLWISICFTVLLIPLPTFRQHIKFLTYWGLVTHKRVGRLIALVLDSRLAGDKPISEPLLRNR